MAAEIAMEHHLGLTCDPAGGLVQIPCIEPQHDGCEQGDHGCEYCHLRRPSEARVSLDDCIKTMWETAQDMATKYGNCRGRACTQRQCPRDRVLTSVRDKIPCSCRARSEVADSSVAGKRPVGRSPQNTQGTLA